MPSSLVLFFATLPLLVLLLPRWIEPYSLLDPAVLNRPLPGPQVPSDKADGVGQRVKHEYVINKGRETRWFNMGWWEATDDFSLAAQSLGTKLLAFARDGEGYQPGGNVLDIGHGAGESLLLHLNTSPPPQILHGLTSLKLDTIHARGLVASHPNVELITDFGGISSTESPGPKVGQEGGGTRVELYTASAEFREGKDLDHPLNPMRGFLGQRKGGRDRASYSHDDEEDHYDYEDEDAYEDDERAQASTHAPTDGHGPTRYSLIYILDSIYHYPPSLPSFLRTLMPVVSPEGGVVVYTDILPPPSLSLLKNRWKAVLLSYVMQVPLSNLVSRPASLDEYETQLRALLNGNAGGGAGEIGISGAGTGGGKDAQLEVGVKVEDWSLGVWPGFARNLNKRGGAWKLVGKMVEYAEKGGWKFVAVRIDKS